MTVTPTKISPRQRDGKVILHVFVHPDVRRGIHLLTSFDGVDSEDVLRSLVRKALRERGLPDLDGLAEPEPATSDAS